MEGWLQTFGERADQRFRGSRQLVDDRSGPLACEDGDGVGRPIEAAFLSEGAPRRDGLEFAEGVVDVIEDTSAIPNLNIICMY